MGLLILGKNIFTYISPTFCGTIMLVYFKKIEENYV